MVMVRRIVVFLAAVMVFADMCFAQGTQNYVAKFSANGTSFVNSSIFADSNGHVGIGTTSPTYSLHVENTDASGTGSNLLFIQSPSSNGARIDIKSTSTNGRRYAIGTNFITGTGEFGIFDYDAGISRIVIGSNGNVGIGTTSPGYQFQLDNSAHSSTAMFGASGQHFLQLKNNSALGEANPLVQLNDKALIFSNGTQGSGGLVIAPWSGAAAGIRMDSAGNVGIGSGTPGYPLEIRGGARPHKVAAFGPAGFNAISTFIQGTSKRATMMINSGDMAVLEGYNDGVGPMGMVLNPAGGNVGIGTSSPGAKLEVNGSLRLTSGSGATVTFPDGTVQSTAWTGVLCGGDYAESIDVSGDRRHYEPGDVLVIDKSNPGSFTKSTEPYSRMVAGIYSTKPGIVGRRSRDVEQAKSEIPMAMVGIVPTKVSAENGPIEPGDLLVTATVVGHVMKGTDPARMTGAIIGKALGTLNSGTGVIDVLVSLQ